MMLWFNICFYIALSMVIAGCILIIQAGHRDGLLAYSLLLFGFFLFIASAPAVIWVKLGLDKPSGKQRDLDET